MFLCSLGQRSDADLMLSCRLHVCEAPQRADVASQHGQFVSITCRACGQLYIRTEPDTSIFFFKNLCVLGLLGLRVSLRAPQASSDRGSAADRVSGDRGIGGSAKGLEPVPGPAVQAGTAPCWGGGGGGFIGRAQGYSKHAQALDETQYNGS